MHEREGLGEGGGEITHLKFKFSKIQIKMNCSARAKGGDHNMHVRVCKLMGTCPQHKCGS